MAIPSTGQEPGETGKVGPIESAISGEQALGLEECLRANQEIRHDAFALPPFLLTASSILR